MEEVESPQAFLRKSPISVASARTPVQVLHPLLLCPHVNSPRQTGLSVRTRATRRLDWGPSTPLRSSDPPVSLVNGHVRRLHQQPGVNFQTDKAHRASCSASHLQTDKAHRASCSASHLQDRQGALRFLFGSSFTNNTDDVYCTSRSATPELTTRTARLVHQPTRPTARTARPVRLLPDRQRALRVQFGILIKGRPRALHVQLGI